MSPSPSTAVPSVTTATTLDFQVYSFTSSGCSAMALHTFATPGVYARERSSLLVTGTVAWMAILPPRCSANTASGLLSVTLSLRGLMISAATSCDPLSPLNR